MGLPMQAQIDAFLDLPATSASPVATGDPSTVDHTLAGRVGNSGHEAGGSGRPIRGGGLPQRSTQPDARAEQQVKDLLDFRASHRIEARTPQTHRIQTRQAVLPVSDTEWGDILTDGRVSLDHRKIPHPQKLVKSGTPSKESAIADANMARQQNVVGQDIAIAQQHVVGEVNPGHQEIAAPETGEAAGPRPAVDGDILTERVLRSDAHPGGGGWIKCQILGHRADHASPADAGIRPDRDITIDPDMAADPDAGLKAHWTFNYGKGTDVHITGDFGFRRNEGGWVYWHAAAR